MTLRRNCATASPTNAAIFGKLALALVIVLVASTQARTACAQLTHSAEPASREAVASALAAWHQSPVAVERLLHHPVQLDLVPVAGTPYFAAVGSDATATSSKAKGSDLLFVCPVAAPRFLGGLVHTELVRFEVDDDSGHAFMHLARCEKVAAP